MMTDTEIAFLCGTGNIIIYVCIKKRQIYNICLTVVITGTLIADPFRVLCVVTHFLSFCNYL